MEVNIGIYRIGGKECFIVKNLIDRELGIALDHAIKEFTLEGVLDVPKHFDKWTGDCEVLNGLSTFQIAKYIIEGYDYHKSKDELFIEWFKNFNVHIPYPTKNSSYRRGRKHTLEAVNNKLIELNLIGE